MRAVLIRFKKYKTKCLSRNFNFSPALNHHTGRSLSSQAVQDKPWKVSYVPHNQPHPPLHLSNSRSNGHSHHEDSMAV